VRDDFELSRRGWKLLLHHSHLLRLMNERSRELNCNQGYCLYGLSLRPDDACRGPYVYGCCGGMPSVISRTVWTRARVVEQVMSKGSCTPSHHIDHRMDHGHARVGRCRPHHRHVHHGGVVDGTARTQARTRRLRGIVSSNVPRPAAHDESIAPCERSGCKGKKERHQIDRAQPRGREEVRGVVPCGGATVCRKARVSSWLDRHACAVTEIGRGRVGRPDPI
jgi:hypothetical protein